MARRRSSLDSLPSEIIERILAFVPPSDLFVAVPCLPRVIADLTKTSSFGRLQIELIKKAKPKEDGEGNDDDEDKEEDDGNEKGQAAVTQAGVETSPSPAGRGSASWMLYGLLQQDNGWSLAAVNPMTGTKLIWKETVSHFWSTSWCSEGGLLCYCLPSGEKYHIVVLNPATGSRREVPAPEGLDFWNQLPTNMGVSVNHLQNSYSVVLFFPNPDQLRVYSSTTQAWSNIEKKHYVTNTGSLLDACMLSTRELWLTHTRVLGYVLSRTCWTRKTAEFDESDPDLKSLRPDPMYQAVVTTKDKVLLLAGLFNKKADLDEDAELYGIGIWEFEEASSKWVKLNTTPDGIFDGLVNEPNVNISFVAGDGFVCVCVCVFMEEFLINWPMLVYKVDTAEWAQLPSNMEDSYYNAISYQPSFSITA